MKIYKIFLHILIALGSMMGFLVGWAILAHAGKPVQQGLPQSSQQALVPLPALPPIQTNPVANNSPLQFVVPRGQINPGFFSRSLSTRGS
jgi:hypothetical protein